MLVRNLILNPRHIVIAQKLADGARLPEIARELGIKHSSLKNHLHQLYLKLGAETQAHFVAYAFRNKLIQ